MTIFDIEWARGDGVSRDLCGPWVTEVAFRALHREIPRSAREGHSDGTGRNAAGPKDTSESGTRQRFALVGAKGRLA